MTFETNRDKGRAGMSLAIGYFGSHGYTVNIPLNDTQWYDLVIEKDGIFQTVQCKATGSKDNLISLRSSGGTNGSVYDSVLNHQVDLLFCLSGEMQIFIIPVEEIRKSGNIKTITLRTQPNKNGIGFDTSKYLISFYEDFSEAMIERVITRTEKVYICAKCGTEVSHKGNLCAKCANKEKRIPLDDMIVSRDELKQLIREKPFTQIGSTYGVTDNSVRKWCDKYNLPKTKKEINSYSDEEWDLI